jgi:hypothetical protein
VMAKSKSKGSSRGKPIAPLKKSTRGSFTAAAKRSGMSVQAKAAAVLRDPNASAAMKKKANFARNAAKWKH